MSLVRLAAVMLALLLAVSPSLALNPTDDDAGSGGDAGDDLGSAVPVASGEHAGRLTQEVDERDVYSVHVERGTHIEVDWGHRAHTGAIRAGLWGPGPDGDPVLKADSPFHNGATLFYTAPTTGTWYLVFDLWAVYDPVPLEYRFHLDLRAHRSLVSISSGADAVVLEANVERSDELFLSMRQDLRHYDTDHDGMLLGALYWDLEWGEDSQGKGSMGYGWGPKWTGMPDRIETGLLPATELPFPVQTFQGDDYAYLRFHLTNMSGEIRLNLAHTYAEVRSELVVSATGEMEGATTEGGPVVVWTTEEIADGDDVLLPGYAQTDGGSLALSVEGPYLGIFMPGEAPGRMVAPNGTIYESSAFYEGRKWLLDPSPGDWRLELDETEDVGPSPDRSYFVGAAFPSLGIVGGPDPGCPAGPYC